MNRLKYAIPVIIVLIITGCIPKRFEWSPDGKWMTIISGAGLRVCDSNGNLLPGTVPNVVIATWFPDSAQLMTTSKRSVGMWAELQPILSPDQVQAITTEAARVKQAAIAYDWTNHDWTSFGQSFDYHVDDSLKAPIALYLTDHPDETWNEKVPLERRKELAAITADVYDLIVCSADASGLKARQPIFSTIDQALELRMSPTGKAVILVTPKSDADSSDPNRIQACRLTIVSTDGSQQPVQLPDNSCWYPDWSADGTTVFFESARQPFSRDASLGTLRSEQVIGDDGKFLSTPDKQTDLAGLFFSVFSRVRCLSDGRIIFTSAQVTLPATPNDLPNQAELFSLMPNQQATVTRLFPRQTVDSIGDGAPFFEVSPDNQYVSVPNSKGEVYVVTLATDAVNTVQNIEFQSNGNGPQLPTVPSWRTGDELTFAEPGDDDSHMKVLLYPVTGGGGTAITLSDNWPAQLRATDVAAPATTEPATQP